MSSSATTTAFATPLSISTNVKLFQTTIPFNTTHPSHPSPRRISATSRKTRLPIQSHTSQNPIAPPSPASNATPQIYFATCARGLGHVLADEIKAWPIHGKVLDIASSGVLFQSTTASQKTAYRACFWLRTAMRVLHQIASYQLPNSSHLPTMADAIYDFIYSATDWQHHLASGHKTFSVQVRLSQPANSNSRSSYRRSHTPISTAIPSDRTVQTRVKDAICDAVRASTSNKPFRPTSHADADLPLFVTIHDARITLYRDMAAASLHKRGYRTGALHRSSLNETVAAAMLYFAGFSPDGSFNGADDILLTDPMCGSGTLLIEAALLRMRIATGLYRRHFVFENWVDFEPDVFRAVVEEAVQAQRKDSEAGLRIVGGDINMASIEMARRDVENMRLENLISLQHVHAEQLFLPDIPTLTVCNPPWGRRLEEGEAWLALGQFLRQHAGGGSKAVVLSGEAGLSQGLRMKAQRRFPVRVGNVDTRVLLYDVLPRLEGGRGGRIEDGKEKRRSKAEGVENRAAWPSEHDMPIF